MGAKRTLQIQVANDWEGRIVLKKSHARRAADSAFRKVERYCSMAGDLSLGAGCPEMIAGEEISPSRPPAAFKIGGREFINRIGAKRKRAACVISAKIGAALLLLQTGGGVRSILTEHEATT